MQVAVSGGGGVRAIRSRKEADGGRTGRGERNIVMEEVELIGTGGESTSVDLGARGIEVLIGRVREGYSDRVNRRSLGRGIIRAWGRISVNIRVRDERRKGDVDRIQGNGDGII